MTKLFWQVCKASPAMISASLLMASSVAAAPVGPKEVETAETLIAQAAETEEDLLEQIDRYSEDSSSDQVTSVEQLRDVSPGDWAFEALRSLVERYGCIEGYPDQTYRGNRALTRYEFAAGLNSCLNAIERLIASSGTGLAPEDLERLQRLAQEFEAELATIGARVDNLEGRVAFLEDNQFSTTTKLDGEAIFAIATPFPIDGEDQPIDLEFNELGEVSLVPDDADDLDDIDSITTLSDRVRLNFEASFTGEDRLRLRLEAGNNPEFDEVTGSDATRLGFEEATDNDVNLQESFYETPIGDRFRVIVGVEDIDLDDLVASVVNPYFESSGNGALSRFARRNPLVYRLSTDQGLGVNFAFSEALSLDIAYLVDGGNEPVEEEGLFNGDFAAAAQINFEPNDRLAAALTYAYTYQPGADVNLAGSTSSALANAPFGSTGTRAHRLGAQASFQLGERINLAGWFGFAFANVESSDSVENNFEDIDYEDANILTAAVNVAFLDLFREGTVLGLIAGIPPYNLDVDDADVDLSDDLGNEDFDELGDFDSVPLFFEGQFRFPLNDNITITPGAYVIVNPNQNSDNAPILVGVIRGTFDF
ncbi:MAG: iron uptake porin [Cyanophyceae cyanobacterium]